MNTSRLEEGTVESSVALQREGECSFHPDKAKPQRDVISGSYIGIDCLEWYDPPERTSVTLV